MHTKLFALTIFFLSAATLLYALPAARAYDLGPTITGGEQPYLSFTGTVNKNSTTTLYSVPADRVFVLTALTWDGGGYSGSDTYKIYRGSEVIMETVAVSQRLFKYGYGAFPFPPGSQLKIENGDSSYKLNYFAQGYLARP